MKKLACFALVNLTMSLPALTSEIVEIPNVSEVVEFTDVVESAKMIKATEVEEPAAIADSKAVETTKIEATESTAATAMEIETTASTAEAIETETKANGIEATASTAKAIKTEATTTAEVIEAAGTTAETTEVASATEALTTEKTNISKTLDTFHTAASQANWVSYFDQMSDDSVFIGTDATERWEKPAFKAYTNARKEGWTYTVRQRHINLTPDGKNAWFDEILDSKNYGTSRGTGVLISTDKGWKIAQYHLTFPIPNSLAVKITTDIKNFEQSTKTLNTFHQAAAEANWTAYFNQMSDDAVFLGTDAAERWEKSAFRAYADTKTEGWSYTAKKRNISFSPNGLAAWFDEILDSKSYGTSRGSGLLINTKDGWKISQYNLTFPVPNDLAVKITSDIKKFEDTQKQAKN